MKQKVQIDVLDVSLYDKGNNPEGDELTDQSSSSEKKSPGGRWWKSKKICLAVSLTLLSSLFGVAIFFFTSVETKPKGNVVKKVAASVHRDQLRYLSLQDCVINVKDRSGKDRFFLCTLMLERSSQDKPLSEEDLIAVRKDIYKLLQKKCFDELPRTRDKVRLREDILREINNRFNSRFAAKIYFTKFVFL
jgi:flagellar basal body-associated protein FliL